ncbi:MAG: helix-turn-helix domain-containing protein [Flavobacteriales bacterium]
MDKLIGERIRKFRALSGLSQENVAEELGMSTANYGKIERGEITISVNHLFAIAAVFHIHPGDFFTEPNSTAKEPNAVYTPIQDFIELQATVATMQKDLAKVKTNVRKLSSR